MDLQEFYQEIYGAITGRTLKLDSKLAKGNLSDLMLTLGISEIGDCTMNWRGDTIQLDGKCLLNNWNKGNLFQVRILWTQQEDSIAYDASLWSDFSGILEDFFGEIGLLRGRDEDGSQKWMDVVGKIWIQNPVIEGVSTQARELLPLRFSAQVQPPAQKPWDRYGYLLGGMQRLEGKLNQQGVFELEVPLAKQLSGLFPCVEMALLMENGIRSTVDIWHPLQSQVGLRVRLSMPELDAVDFTIPLFGWDMDWTLTADFPQGLGVADVANLMLRLFGAGGSAEALCLPPDTALNQFKLYRLSMLARRQELDLGLRYLIMDFALAKPWSLPVPYVTLEQLYISFEISKGDGKILGDLLTARAGGKVSVMLGSYKLALSLEMELPSREFIAQAVLSQPGGQEPLPSLPGMAQTMGVPLPAMWAGADNALARVTVWGAMEARSFAIEAEVKDLLAFQVGNLTFSLDSLVAGGHADTAGFSFYVQGIISFAQEKEDGFAIYLKAEYRNPGWVFSGGLERGTVDIGQLLTQMFRIENPAKDIFSLQLSELDVQYETETSRFALTAVFSPGWHIQLLGKSLVLGGRIQILQKNQALDVAALAYISLGNFLLLAQINQVHREEDRSYLFRLQYGTAYLQAAWFYRKQDEILAVSLGGMSLGQLMESLVRMVNPNKRYHLPSPWDVLNKIQLSRFLLELNVTQNQATFLYRADLNLAGLLYLDSLGVRYDMDQRKLYFVLTGSMLGVTYGEANPITWDAIDERPPANKAENEQTFQLHYLGLGQHLKNQGIAQAENITAAMAALRSQLTPEQLASGVAFDAGTNWLFGADFTVDNMVRLQLVLNDPTLYGLLVTVQGKSGSVLEALDGLGIELLCKKVSDTVYLFRGELLVPKRYRTFQLGAVSLTLGTIRMEIYTNGGFCVDLGFPYNLDFSRSFVLEWGIFTGRGGIYLGVMRQVSVPNLPKVTSGSFSPIVTLGIGLSVGLGRSFDLGIVKGGLSAEVFGLFEGVLAVFHPEQTQQENPPESLYYYVKAMAGITGRLYLSVDFKILSVQASALIQASAMLTIQAYRATEVELELSLELSASIKILFIKISFSFSFHQKVAFTFGSDQPAPWEMEEGNRLPVRTRRYILAPLEPPILEQQAIRLSLVPMFYLADPTLDDEVPKQYGAAFLMMMDRPALEQWGGLLAEWALSAVEGDTVAAEAAQAWAPDLADAITYEKLDDFLCKNVRFSLEIHWVEAENRLRSRRVSEAEGFVFPMLPGLVLSFGTEDKMATVDYGTWQMVGGSYFDFLTAYFRELDPNQNRAVSNNSAAETGPMPITQAFFLDYFQMFFREVLERLKRPFAQWNTTLGVMTAAEQYGLPVAEILRQNPGLQLRPGLRLVLPSVRWITLPADSLDQIVRRFGCEPNALWESVRKETFLLETGAALQYGIGKLDNRIAGFTLEQAAAFLFVRFYEEETPEELFYAGDLIRLNPELDIRWQETIPGGHTLTLPEGAGTYRTMRGDTPERIGKYLHLLQMDRNSLSSWRIFYEELCRCDGAKPQDVLETVQFEVPQVRLLRDTSLLELARRIYPDGPDDELPGAQLWAAPILRCNVPVQIPGVVYQAEQESTVPVTVEDILTKLPCTWEELGAAVSGDDMFCPAELSLCGAAQMPKQELKQTVMENAAEIGAMLSRLLLQGLTVPPPEAENADPEPLFKVLGQMFLLEQPRQDYILQMTAGQGECPWVPREEQTERMAWQEIEPRLPSGRFSALASAWQCMEDFAPSPQYFTLQDGAVWRKPKGQGYLYSFSEAVQRVVREASVLPALMDEQGAVQPGKWGCLLPISIAKTRAEGVFTVYGADALKRRVLHSLLSVQEVSVHFLYQASAVSKGNPDFWEYDWSDTDSFLIKTNLSTETHMGPLRVLKGSSQTYIAAIAQPQPFLRMLWECSTVGGGGYYMQLLSKEGQTLPEDLFESDGTAELWLLAQSGQGQLPGECINCLTLAALPKENALLSLVTQDPAQQVEQPVFPVGCVGLCSQQPAPQEGSNEPENDIYMRSLFQITGYQILANDAYEESHCSAPLMPEEAETLWQYHAVVPVYRYLRGDQKDNPYRIVGQQSVIALEQRDVLGNTLRIGETPVVPHYNDVLIGVGQYPAAKVSYALLGTAKAPILRLNFHTALPQSSSSESAAYQRSAARQLACDDLQVFLSSPVNQQRFSLAEQKQAEVSGLDRLRAYAEALADAMEGIGGPPEDLALDFDLDLEQYPLPAEIFRLEARVTVQRSESLAPAGAARRADTVVFPSCAKEQGGEEQSLVDFCDAASNALPDLYLAQNADEDGVLYGISHGPNGLIRQLSVFPLQYFAITTTGEQRLVQAPEFYALRPLYHGLLSRTAKVRSLSDDYTLAETYEAVAFSDVDLEVWGRQFLADVEALLAPDQLKKAAAASTETLDQLIAGKETLAQAIAGQMTPLRNGGMELQEKWRSFMSDRLKRSLTAGYNTDVTAVYGMTFETADPNLYRLEGTACHAMAGAQVVMGKAENNCQEIAACFTNDFQAKSQPLQADLLFTELEYDILSDQDGYESSRWLRFVKPIRPDRKTPDQHWDLGSALDLPNPLRECPQPPMLDGHTCSIHFASKEEKRAFRALSEQGVCWDYQLTFRFPYKEQDTLKIRVEFQDLDRVKRAAAGRDLFDALAEYQLIRDRLWKSLVEQTGESSAYQTAFAAFAGITQQTAVLWQAWTAQPESRRERRSALSPLAYSCTAEGTFSVGGAAFRVVSTEEGKAFWAQLGLAEQIPLLEAALVGNELSLRFTLKNLPLFSCAQAVPSVSVVRNQNLLSGDGFSLEICEDFIYRTQEVSLQPLMVSGEYNGEYTLASLSAAQITQETMEQAAKALYQALGLAHPGLEAEVSVFYDYHLAFGGTGPRIELPVTFLSATPTAGSQTWVQTLAANLYQWYRQMEPSTQDCGLRFDVKLYKAGERKGLLHFSHLRVKL